MVIDDGNRLSFYRTCCVLIEIISITVSFCWLGTYLSRIIYTIFCPFILSGSFQPLVLFGLTMHMLYNCPAS